MQLLRKHPFITLLIFYLVFVFLFAFLEGKLSSVASMSVFWPGVIIAHILAGFSIQSTLFLPALIEIIIVLAFFFLWYYQVWRKQIVVGQPLVPTAQATPSNALVRFFLLPISFAALSVILGFIYLFLGSHYDGRDEGLGLAGLAILLFYPAPVFLITFILGKIFRLARQYRRAILVEGLVILGVGAVVIAQVSYSEWQQKAPQRRLSSQEEQENGSASRLANVASCGSVQFTSSWKICIGTTVQSEADLSQCYTQESRPNHNYLGEESRDRSDCDHAYDSYLTSRATRLEDCESITRTFEGREDCIRKVLTTREEFEKCKTWTYRGSYNWVGICAKVFFQNTNLYTQQDCGFINELKLRDKCLSKFQ